MKQWRECQLKSGLACFMLMNCIGKRRGNGAKREGGGPHTTRHRGQRSSMVAPLTLSDRGHKRATDGTQRPHNGHNGSKDPPAPLKTASPPLLLLLLLLHFYRWGHSSSSCRHSVCLRRPQFTTSFPPIAFEQVFTCLHSIFPGNVTLSSSRPGNSYQTAPSTRHFNTETIDAIKTPGAVNF